MSKFSTSKLISIVFCGIAVIVLVGLIVIYSATSGQMKTIDKAYSSFTHGIYKEYSQCFEGNSISEKEFDDLREQYLTDWGEDFAVKAEFYTREKHGNGYIVYVRVYTYNENDHISSAKEFFMTKSKGKWLISNA